MESLSRAQARRAALAAQGFTDPPHAAPTRRTLARTVSRTQVLQVDSVNVLQRAHLMPLYSRMGPYDPALLERAATGRSRLLVEYWAHVQALMPVELWPVMQHRMEDYRVRRGKWGQVLVEDPELVPTVRALVRERGPVTARELEPELAAGPRSREHWGWNWSSARKALDFLYMGGELAIAGRTPSFEVRYDVPERVLPAAPAHAPPRPGSAWARPGRRRAAASCGVADVVTLRDYFRMAPAETRTAIEELVEAGELVPVRVEGWSRPAYRFHRARVPRRVHAHTLLSPFDPVVWERSRTEALFGFRYRIEIYTPPAKRVHGYYVLPFLWGDRLVSRVDLKADRPGRRLLVRAAYAEPGGDDPDAVAALAVELRRLAGWLGLDEVEVGARGDLSGALRDALT